MVLQTPRLVLKPFQESDAPALYDYARDPRVGPAAGWRPHRSLEESREAIRKALSAHQTFAVWEREGDCLVGSAGFTGLIGQEGGAREIGYSLRPDRWGRGYATEAVGALTAYSFRPLGLPALWASHYDGNQSSRRVLEKNGFTWLFAQDLRDDLGDHLVHFYQLTREEWSL